MESSKMVSVKNAEHYVWGENNDGWYLLKKDGLSVIEERMEPGTSERLHFHEKAQQLFYILSGEAGFESGEKLIQLGPGESVHVPPGKLHKIFNNRDTDLRFIVISSPESHGDRIDI